MEPNQGIKAAQGSIYSDFPCLFQDFSDGIQLKNQTFRQENKRAYCHFGPRYGNAASGPEPA